MAISPASIPARSSGGIAINGPRFLRIKVRRGLGLLVVSAVAGSYAAINPGLVLEAARWLVAAGVIAFAIVAFGASLLAGVDRFAVIRGDEPTLDDRS